MSLLGIVAATFCATKPALSSPPRRGARIVWARGEGAETCVGPIALADDVKARLGYSPFELAPAIEIEGTALRTASGFRADLALRSADGQSMGRRHFESREKDCRTLGDAVAVAITVAIDPDASGAAAPAVEERPPEAAPEPPSPLRPPARKSSVRVTAHAGASVGLVPGVGPTFGLRAALFASDHVEGGIGAMYIPESREGVFGFGLAVAEAGGCFDPWGALGIGRLCVAALAGAFETYSFTQAMRPIDIGVYPWLAVEGGPILSVPLAGAVRAELKASATVPILRREGLVRGTSSPVWEQSSVGGRAELGVSMLF